MRVLVDLKSYLAGVPEIVQVQNTPGDDVVVNGKAVIPMPLDAEFPVQESDYILDGGGHLDGKDVVSQGFARLLAASPIHEHIYFNPLITADHVDGLDWDGEFFEHEGPHAPRTLKARFQSGREPGPPNFGQMPSHTALLPVNDGLAEPRPGLIVTKPIDISAYTLNCDEEPEGASEFSLFWLLVDFEVSHDVSGHDMGATANQNTPALRTFRAADSEPDGFSAYLSTDGGETWCEAHWMAPITGCTKTTEIMVAFRNDSSSKRYLASFAVLF
jgi:hypothetical protein